MSSIGPAGVSRGALRSGDATTRHHRDWSSYIFERNISPMNVDGLFVIESRGHFLFLELKYPNEAFPDAQRKALAALSRLPGVGVVCVIGSAPAPVAMQWCRGGIWEPERPADHAFLQGLLAGWFARQKRP